MSSSTMTQSRVGPRSTPPFRADHVGSLLRPRELAAARAERKAGRLSAEALRAIEDRCIEAAIRKQEEIGLRAATDGEYRRAFWHYDFVSGLDGIELYAPEQPKIVFKGGLPPMSIDGDGALAADVNWIAPNVRWDPTADAERFFGPTIAEGVSRANAQFAQAAEVAKKAMGQMLDMFQARNKP